MATRTAYAMWQGGLKGQGEISLGDGRCAQPYSASSRFESGPGTNPEELLGAAFAGCFNMALAVRLQDEGFVPQRISTDASTTIEKVGGGFEITSIHLDTVASVPDIDVDQFIAIAEDVKNNCPVGKALSATHTTLSANIADQARLSE
jgi:osmotically inducible protein OsmC